MGGIPGTKRSHWTTNEIVIECIGSVPPLVAAIVGTITFARDSSKPIWMAYATGLAGVWLLAASVLRITKAWNRESERQLLSSPTDLQACAHVLYGQLCTRCGFDESDNLHLRVTIHRVVPNSQGGSPTQLEQVIPYVGGKGGAAGRVFSIKSGLIGLAAREHAPFAMSWDGTNPKGFIQQLMHEYHYTEDEAEHLVSSRRSWFAVPLSGKNQKSTVGVLFLDSGDPSFFTDETKAIVLEVAFGIARYIRERYD